MIICVPVFATVIIVVNNLIEKKLKAKGLPTDTNDYMGENSMSDIDIILHNSEGAWIHNIKKVFKKNKKNTETESTENNADSVNSNEEPVDNNKAD